MRCLAIATTVVSESDGLSIAVLGLSRALGAIGHQVRLMSVDPVRLPDSIGFQHDPKRVARILRVGARSPEFNRALHSAVPSHDVVHVHGLWRFPGIEAARVARSSRTPLVLSVHGMLTREALRISPLTKKAFWNLIQAEACRAASVVHATSCQEFQAIRSHGIMQPVAILPVGVEAPANEDVRSPRGKTVLYLGRIHPIKGLDVLLAAWSRLKRSGFGDWTLRIVGPEGSTGYRRLLDRHIHEESVPGVEFRGAVTGAEKWREYRGASIMVLPSRSENFGITVAESLSVGTPVITTDQTPWEDLPSVGCGWCVPLSAESIESALRQAMSLGEKERSLMGMRGQIWISNRYSWPKVAAGMAEVYEWLLSGGHPPSCVRTD